MPADTIWQEQCSGYVRTEVVNGLLWVVGWGEDELPDPRVTEGLQVLYTFEQAPQPALEGHGSTLSPEEVLFHYVCLNQLLP